MKTNFERIYLPDFRSLSLCKNHQQNSRRLGRSTYIAISISNHHTHTGIRHCTITILSHSHSHQRRQLTKPQIQIQTQTHSLFNSCHRCIHKPPNKQHTTTPNKQKQFNKPWNNSYPSHPNFRMYSEHWAKAQPSIYLK